MNETKTPYFTLGNVIWLLQRVKDDLESNDLYDLQTHVYPDLEAAIELLRDRVAKGGR